MNRRKFLEGTSAAAGASALPWRGASDGKYGLRVAPSIHGYRSLGVGSPNVTHAQ